MLDCSGSMEGAPIEHAKAAISRGLDLLQPGDSFQLIDFSMRASQLGDRPLNATPANIRRAREYLHRLSGEGGTMMIEGIRAALNFPHDSERLRFVFFLTDGYIGNEHEILGEVHQRLGDSRIFSFGIGSAVNRYLLDEMARAGRGAVAYLGPRDSAPGIMEDFFARISHPALTDLQLDCEAIGGSEIYPRQIPDLFSGRPVVITGRFERAGPIRVLGKCGGREMPLPAIRLEAPPGETPALPSVWARMKIADLTNDAIRQPNPELPKQIQQLALDYNLMSSFTAFVAVDATRRTEGDHGTTVPVAVPVPEGVKYDTTVPE